MTRVVTIDLIPKGDGLQIKQHLVNKTKNRRARRGRLVQRLAVPHFLLRCGLIPNPGTKLRASVFIEKLTVAQLVNRFSTSYKSYNFHRRIHRSPPAYTVPLLPLYFNP
jgi:hypothetical protein